MKIREDGLNLSQLRAYRPDWPWEKFNGSAACIKWSFRDLQNLERTLQVTPGRNTVVQAGGNLGIFPKRLAEEFQTVITFEPDPKLFQILKQNAPEPNIIAYNKAIGNSHDSVSVATKRRDASGRAVHEGLTHISGKGKIEQILIDDLDLQACDLIYLDIEGYEKYALEGAVKTIEKFKPVITVEVNKSIEFYGLSKDSLREWIKSKGYALSFSINSDEIYTPC